VRRWYSVVFLRIGPRGEPRHPIDFVKQPADELIPILPGTESVNVRNQPRQNCFEVSDRLLRVVLTLLLEALPVLEQLLAVEGNSR